MYDPFYYLIIPYRPPKILCLCHGLFTNNMNVFYVINISNVLIKHVFSHIENIWTKSKTQLQGPAFKALFITKLNLDYNCLKFYKLLKQSPTF